MSQTLPRPDAISRTAVIDLLREELLSRLDDETSICKLAAEKGIFCRGFRRWSESELRRRFGWIDRKRPMSREELEDLANRWQLARQEVRGASIACDVQRIEHDMCGGWDDFSNEELSRFYFELTGKNIRVV